MTSGEIALELERTKHSLNTHANDNDKYAQRLCGLVTVRIKSLEVLRALSQLQLMLAHKAHPALIERAIQSMKNSFDPSKPMTSEDHYTKQDWYLHANPWTLDVV